MLDLESLRCFVAATTHPSFRVAARAVALSPAAFGDRIARLEDDLGAPLFIRTTRRVALAPAGQRLLPQATRTLAEAEACRTAIHETHAPLPFALSLGTRFELGLSWLVPALPALATAHPERTVHLVFGDSPDLIRRLRDGLVDAVVTSARLGFQNLVAAHLHDEAYVFVASKRASKLARQTLLDITPDLPLFRYVLETARQATYRFTHHEYLGTIGAIRARVLQHAGVAVLPKYFVADDLARGRLVQLLASTRLARDAFRLVWRANHPRDAELRALATELAALPLR